MNKMNDFKLMNSNPRRSFIKKIGLGSLGALGLTNWVNKPNPLDFVSNSLPENEPRIIKPDHFIRSVPENMVWGYYGANVPPIAHVKDGDIVEIQTINTAGISRKDPEAFFKKNNLPLDEQAKDIMEIYQKVKPEPSGLTGHMLTGPLYIEGAEPGDMLEVRILDIKLRSDYGVNAVWPKGGDLPDAVVQDETFVYKYNRKKNTASFKTGIEIPLKPFMGVMALSPPPEMGRVSSIPPAFYGGNLDLKHLIKGTTLYLPVSTQGGLFTTGDCHAAEGNGEISGVAIEASLSLVVKFVVHKNKALKQVRAETPTHFIAIGLDADLNKAMKNASLEAVQFIQNE
jgi:acetamidase/formamidase